MRVISVLGVVGALACASANAGVQPLPFTEQLTSLGRLDPSHRRRIFIGPDQSRVAWVKPVGNQMAMVVDGVAGQPFDFIEEPVFSADGSRILYVGRVGDQFTLVLDGKPTPAYREIHDARFSNDSRHVLYVARADADTESLIVDGVPQGQGRYFYVRTPVFSPDDKTVVFDAMKGRSTDHSVLVRNGVESPIGDEITDITFSPDGKHLAAIRHHDGRHVSVIFDGNESPPYPSISSIMFSGDSQHYFYEVMQDNQAIAVIDGKPQKPMLSMQRFDFAPKGPRYIYLNLLSFDMSKGMLAVIDGKEFGPVATVAAPVFSSDGTRLAFRMIRTVGGPMTMWVDGVEQRPFADVEMPVFSPDGKRLAYAAKLNAIQVVGSDVMVLDGATQPAYDGAWDPTFSPDSRHFAYRAFRRGKPRDGQRIVLDGVEQSIYFATTAPVFSADSVHCAYLATDGGKCFAVVDGQETQKLDELVDNQTARPVFDVPDRFHFLAMKANEVFRVNLSLHATK